MSSPGRRISREAERHLLPWLKQACDTLDEDTPQSELVRLAKIRWRVEHDYQELKTGLGLDRFEGRSWLGWHHHAILVTAALLFITTLRLADPEATGQD